MAGAGQMAGVLPGEVAMQPRLAGLGIACAGHAAGRTARSHLPLFAAGDRRAAAGAYRQAAHADTGRSGVPRRIADRVVLPRLLPIQPGAQLPRCLAVRHDAHPGLWRRTLGQERLRRTAGARVRQGSRLHRHRARGRWRNGGAHRASPRAAAAPNGARSKNRWRWRRRCCAECLPGRLVLVDCLTLWLSNLMFCDGREYPEVGDIDAAGPVPRASARTCWTCSLTGVPGDVVLRVERSRHGHRAVRRHLALLYR